MSTINSLVDLGKAKGISIASLNIRSIMRHLDEIKLMLELGDINILLLQETFLNISVPDAVVNIDCYKIFQFDRDGGSGKRGGGGFNDVCKELFTIGIPPQPFTLLSRHRISMGNITT